MDSLARIEMSNFNADDTKVYEAWLRRTLAIYAGIVLLAGGTIAVFALTEGPTAVSYLATALNLAAP
jgi:hypothetical protein